MSSTCSTERRRGAATRSTEPAVEASNAQWREENHPRNLYLGLIGPICGLCAAYLFGIIGYSWAGADLARKSSGASRANRGVPRRPRAYRLRLHGSRTRKAARMDAVRIDRAHAAGGVCPRRMGRPARSRAFRDNQRPSPRTATPEAVASRQREAEDKWLADIVEAAAHGASNAQPPMLAVRDDGRAVTIRNLSDLKIQCVAYTAHQRARTRATSVSLRTQV